MNYVALLLQILASPGGQAALEKLFVEKGLSVKDLHAVIVALPDPPPPRVADRPTTEVPKGGTK